MNIYVDINMPNWYLWIDNYDYATWLESGTEWTHEYTIINLDSPQEVRKQDFETEVSPHDVWQEFI